LAPGRDIPEATGALRSVAGWEKVKISGAVRRVVEVEVDREVQKVVFRDPP
jgi:hypothetical protein